MALPDWTNQQVFDQMNSGSTWTSQVITYAFPQFSSQFGPNLADEAAGFSPINTAQLPLVNLSMILWDDLIAPQIMPGSAQTANILVSNTSNTDGYAFAFYPKDGGSVWFSSNYANLQNPKVGEDSFITFVHEVGHALGLNHMGDYNGNDNNGPSSIQDSDLLSIMSYYGPGMNDGEGQVAWGNWLGHSAQTPMLHDIMVIQAMYGADTTTRAGDTVYGFGSNIQGPTAQIYDFSINQYPILTIYDAGGNDTLNLSGWGTDGTVDLRPGHYSSVNGMTQNLAIAYGVFIEKAITGAGDDVLRGNMFDNYLDGGAGEDTVLFLGDYADYSLRYDILSREYAVQDTAVGRDGTDTLLNIEVATFGDLKGNLGDLTPGVHRFYNTELSSHFYTADNNEASAAAQMSNLQYDGTGFERIINGADTVSVQRFLNAETGEHFYTAGTAEADYLRELNGAWQYEGVAFQAYASKVDGTTELYRFVNKDTGAHFYTADTVEMDAVMLNSYFAYEGVAFYVAA